MHRQLGALREMVAALDPELHTLLAARDATNYFFCYRWCASSLLIAHCLHGAKQHTFVDWQHGVLKHGLVCLPGC